MLLYMTNSDFHLAGDGKVGVYSLNMHVLRVKWRVH